MSLLHRRIVFYGMVCLVLLALFGCRQGLTPSAAQTPNAPKASPKPGASPKPVVEPRAQVVDAFGQVSKKLPNGKDYAPLNVGDLLLAGTTLRTGDDSAILLELPGGHTFRVGAKTVVVLNELGKDKNYAFKVMAGQVWSLVRKTNRPAKYEISTPSAVAGVSGTLFSVGYDLETDTSTVSTDEGKVNVQEDGRLHPVAAGQFVRFRRVLGEQEAPLRLQPIVRAQSPRMRQIWRLLHRYEDWTDQREVPPPPPASAVTPPRPAVPLPRSADTAPGSAAGGGAPRRRLYRFQEKTLQELMRAQAETPESGEGGSVR